MAAPLLRSKLYLPRPRGPRVARERLREALDAGAAATLVLVSAPAGFGKTTVVADWLAARDHGAAAWLSLDREDSEPTRFWSYVLAALGTAVPGLGVDELALLGTGAPPPLREVLTSVLNDLTEHDVDVVLVLDDYHLVESLEVQEVMAFVLDHAPPQLHLVIASRTDPAVPLARLRARGELVELRAADLRFTPAEATAYLTDVMGLELAAPDVLALGERTEGWIAALQLAALSMRGRSDPGAFVAKFTGDDRYVVDYLVEEVLQRQPAEIRAFLLQTSVLARLSGPLCDAVTATTGGRSVLEVLERDNLFLVPLDDRREWYRFHHLFADMLRARLAEESPDVLAELHARACTWYAEHGHPAEAVEHALAGNDADRAAALMELSLPEMSRTRQEATLRHWVERLPLGILEVRPVLSNGYAGALMSTGEFQGVEQHLRAAERWLEPRADDHGTERAGTVVADGEGLRLLPSGVAVHRAGLALATGDPVAAVGHARRALDLLGDEDHLGHAAAHALIGLASWAGGDLTAARDAYATSFEHMRRAGHLADLMGLSLALADLQVTQGDLREARRTYERALAVSAEQGSPALRGTADMYVGTSMLLREQDDLTAAHDLLARSELLGAHNGLPQNPYRSRVALAGLREAEGDLDGAETLLDEAERVYAGDFSPDVRPVAATRARLWLRQGRTADAVAWARAEGLRADDELAYLREYAHLTLARILLAQEDAASTREATGLLHRLLASAEAGRRTGPVIEVLVLQSLARKRADDVEGALSALGRALELAEPEGYARVFLDEGPPVRELLRAAARGGTARTYVERLLAAGSGADRPAQALVDPLSARELHVLRLLAGELSGPQIARELVVSLNTVRTHTKAVYAKLAVSSRRAAVRRGEELGLLSTRPGA